jgi:DNA repair protein RadC
MKTSILREQLQHYGIQSLSTEELLTLIFCTEPSTGRMDVLKQVQKLLTNCGDLQGVLSAEFGEICLSHGFGEKKAAQLQAVLELAKRLATQQPAKKYQIRSAEDAAQLVRMDMMYLDHEEMRVLVLDTKNYVLANVLMYQGTINSSVLRIAEIFRPAITRKAANIIVCHNHPSGDATPSPEDIDVTKQLVEAGKMLDIELLDHLVIGNPRYVSLKERIRW